eukprot:TRINITY_DN19951_c0_g1_i1.p1 TRINITY_DN19951_c0_g1~~TRINITY_DN19951_c0_g1_i1.p1  ORF type:complete len:159 (-),score=14.49 TRINITY_DN19951_c0_g1_i1:23-499(-)
MSVVWSSPISADVSQAVTMLWVEVRGEGALDRFIQRYPIAERDCRLDDVASESGQFTVLDLSGTIALTSACCIIGLLVTAVKRYKKGRQRVEEHEEGQQAADHQTTDAYRENHGSKPATSAEELPQCLTNDELANIIRAEISDLKAQLPIRHSELRHL